MGSLRKDLAAKDSKFSITLDNGQVIPCRRLTGADQIKLAELIKSSELKDYGLFVSALWVMLSVLNEDGEREFKDDELDVVLDLLPETIAEIAGKIIEFIGGGVDKKVKNSEIPETESTENSSSVSA